MKRHKYLDGRIKAIVIAGEYYGKDLALDLRSSGFKRLGVKEDLNFIFSLNIFNNNPIGIGFSYFGNTSLPKNLMGYILDITGKYDFRYLSSCLDQICDQASIEVISSERQEFDKVFSAFIEMSRIK